MFFIEKMSNKKTVYFLKALLIIMALSGAGIVSADIQNEDTKYNSLECKMGIDLIHA